MKTKEMKGITLIALVITIVVLLILAGVSINLLLGDNGIITKATEAKDSYSKSAVKEKVSFLLNEYTIGKATGENAELAKFLRKNLQVGVAENEDDTYSFILGDWQIVTSESEIISIEKFKLEVDKTYSSVDDMKTDTSLTAGKIVKTEGYYNKNLGGGAYYDIVSTTSLSVDNAICIQLDNGLYAELHVIDNTVSVNQFGAYGDGEHDDADAINLAINSSFSNISFESSQYKINSRIDINKDNKFVFGNDSEIFYDDDFVFVDDFIVRICKSSDQIVKNISIDRLKIINKNSTRTAEHLMLKIINAENIDVTNCKIEAVTDENNKNRCVTNMDLREYWKNINIDGCEFINTTLAPAGGTIWIRAGKNGTGNLNFTNNKIKKSSHDETIGIFGTGVVNNVKISNNTIDFDDTNVEKKSNPVMCFGLQSTQVENVEFSGNNVKVIAGGAFMLFDKADNIMVYNNTFELTSLSDLTGCTYFVATEYASNVKFENNKVDLFGKNSYSEIFGNIAEIKNNIINVKTPFVYFIQKCNEMSNNTVTFYNKFKQYDSIFVIRETSLNKDINVCGNKFIFNTKLTESTRFINIYKSYLNNFKVTISNNEILTNYDQSTNKQFAVYFQGMKDTSPKKIYMKNNSLGFYSNNIGKYDNLTDYNVIEE